MGAAGRPGGPARPRPAAVGWAAPAALLVLSAALYVPLLALPFVADDYPNLLHPWNFVAAASPEFRPLQSVLLVAQRAAFGLVAWRWHLLSLALHLGCVGAAYALALRLAAGRGAPWRATALAAVAAAVFLLDPRGIQAVVWPSAVGDLGYSLAFLAALLVWCGPGSAAGGRGGVRPYLCSALYLVALGFKEAAILLPLVLLAAGFTLHPRGLGWRERLGPLLPCLLVGAAFGAFEAVRPGLLRLLGDRAVFVYAVTGGYHLVRGRLLARNALAYPELTLFPWLPQAWALQPQHLRLLAGPAGALLLYWWMRGGLRRLGVVWIAATVAPALLFAPYDVSDLYLYLPVLGLGLALAEEVWPPGPGASPRLLGAAALAALLFLEGVGFARLSTAWRRDGAAFSRARATLVAVARAHPTATLLVRGLPAFDGEVYLWMDAFPFVLRLLAPDFQGRVTTRPAAAGPGALVLSFGPGGRLRRAVPPG